MENQALPCQVIYQIDVNVISKRPDKTHIPAYKFALLNICPEREGEIQRPVISITWQGKKYFKEFERVQVFDNEQVAKTYAEINNIPMANFKDNPDSVEYVESLRESGVLPQDLRQDLVVLEIEKNLPQTWELVQTDAQKNESPQKFSLKAKFKVWELNENKINAPINPNTPAQELARLKKYGQEIYPQITFSLHQPWRAEELKAVAMVQGNIGDSPLTRFYRNTQYYGLKLLNYNGLEDAFHSVSYLAKQTTTYQIYEIIRDILEPKTILGKAQNAKMGACLVGDDKEVYFIEQWAEWEDKYLDKRLIIKGLQIVKNQSNNQPLRNEKGEYNAGAQGVLKYLVKVELPQVRTNPSLVVVFKKEILEKTTQQWMNETGYYFYSGADSSKGKVYHSKTGQKYHIIFPNEAEKTQFLNKYQASPQIYEIYEPNWNLFKD
ncbi:MAG: hypothetical protein MUE85_20685 [Microscillaceae bacterium]|nr:hypothetical protein [Microscillaceae bacterium]